MLQIMQNLREISTGYSVFEKDQVLTHDQLNGIARYFEDQTRLTRIKLLGIGIVCGLRVSKVGDTVKVTAGVGVTTDGDLLYFDRDTVFDRFKSYDKSKPAYPPFYDLGEGEGGEKKMIAVYELVQKDVTDASAMALSQFDAEAGSTLDAKVAVLLMESYINDPDLCSGTDCDNLGKDYLNTIKLLLVDKTDVGLLQKTVPTPDKAARALKTIVVSRPLIVSTVTSADALAALYRTVYQATHRQLLQEFRTVYSYCSTFLSDLFPTNPVPDWTAKLNTLLEVTNATSIGIQYYYDFMKDIAETYNHFRELLFGDTTVCDPNPVWFPKHLLLGNLIQSTDSGENRTGLYPSPLVSHTSERLNHAKFLAQKLNALIQTFEVPTPTVGVAVRVTPSLFEDQSLDERAIPYYYNVAKDVYTSWNYHLHQRKMDRYNYSYNAVLYNALGAAANPLASQIGRFSFFRIEGYLGQNVSTVLKAIQTEIESKNLPFVVRAVLLGTDRTKVVKKSDIRYTDLHRFHYLLRQDLYHQLGEMAQFSGVLKKQIDTAVDNGTITDSSDDNDGASVKEITGGKNAVVTAKTTAAMTKLNQPYLQYKSDSSWESDVSDTLIAATELKKNLGKVIRTDFATPADTLASSTHTQWINWLDEIITKKDEKADAQLLFKTFVSEHPALEHFAGVTRGGTFVLVYGTDNIVVADFMLPYLWSETTEEEDMESTLTKSTLKSDQIVENGIAIQQSLNKVITKKLDLFNATLKETLQTQLNAQKDYFNVSKDVAELKGRLGISGPIKTAMTSTTDALLNFKMKETALQEEKVALLREKANALNVADAQRTQYKQEAIAAEAELAESIVKTTQYVAESGMAVSTGSAGYNAMSDLSKRMSILTDTAAIAKTTGGLTGVQQSTANTDLKVILGNMTRG